MEEAKIRKGEAMPQFSIMVENRPGALSALVDFLRDSDIEVLGISLGDSVDVTIVRLIISSPDLAEPLFVERGIPFIRSEMVLVEIDGASRFPACLKALQRAETNIHFSYALMVQPNGKPVLAFSVEDVDFTLSILNKCGFRTLYQQDIVR